MFSFRHSSHPSALGVDAGLEFDTTTLRFVYASPTTPDETYDYDYNAQELAEIRDRIRRLRNLYPSIVVIANNHYRGSEVANALELKASLTGQKVAVPDNLLLRFARLNEIAVNRALF